MASVDKDEKGEIQEKPSSENIKRYQIRLFGC
jgi:hypothetical protein